MHLSVLLLTTLPLSVYSCIMHTTSSSTFPKERLEGFKHLDAKDFVARMMAAGLEPGCDKTPAAVKYQLVCAFSYCHGPRTPGCYDICGKVPFDREIIGAAAKTINGKTKPVADVKACQKACEATCGKNKCAKECDYLCNTHFSFKNRKEYEAEFNELVGRFAPQK